MQLKQALLGQVEAVLQLQTKILTAMAAIFLAHFLSVEYTNHHQVRKDVLQSVREDARVVRGLLMSLRDVYQQQFLDHDIPVNDQTLGFLPAHSISRISRKFRDWIDTGLTFNNVSTEPWNPDNAADAIEREAIAFFRQNENELERLVPFINEENEPFYHFSQPIWVNARCLKCHGPPEEIPVGIRQRYPMAQEYEIGDLRGVMSIKLPARIIEERAASLTRQNVATHSIGFLATFLILSLLLKHTVLGPVARLDATAQRLANGDYGARADLPGNDELARVSRTFDSMADRIRLREKTLSIQKSLFEALSETNKSILRLDSRQSLFERVCVLAVEQEGLKHAWIGLIDHESGAVEQVASAGISSLQLPPASVDLNSSGTGTEGPAMIALHEKRAVVVNDIALISSAQPWCAMALKEGIASVAIFPISSQGEVIGIFSFYSGECDYFSNEIVSLLEEMNSDIVFAIHHYRLAEDHEQAHRQLEQSSTDLERLNRQLTLLLESTGEGIFGVDTVGKCIFVNRAALQILGYERDDLIGQGMHELTHHSHADGTEYPGSDCPVYNAFRTGESGRVQNELFWRKDGTSFPVEYSAHPIRDGNELTGSVTVFRDVSESHAMARKMNFLATHDTLTKLLNRYAFEQQLELSLDAMREDTQGGHALCYMDLNQFKVVNDTCGHVAGDAMLQMVAHLIRETVRKNDTLARLGGDEFALLLKDCSLERAERLSQKICEVLREFRFTWKDKNFNTSISIGVVRIDHESESTHELFSAADSACYVAKEMGRNRVYVLTGSDEEVARKQGEMQWVSEIQSAIEDDRLFLHYQPIVALRNEAHRTHFELLLRMRDKDGKNVAPGAFIPAAERYDLMPILDRWVIRTAFRWLSRHPLVQTNMAFCAINLSGQSLADDKLHEYIEAELAAAQLPADKVCFEITETAAVGRLDQAVHFISHLKSKGFRFALDDFGTGMSSFAYLKTLPVNYLKIDGAFVRDIVTDPIDRAMVSSIHEIGHLMGLETIAEYVENDAIRTALIDIGVDFAQGFGIARPGPLDAMLDALPDENETGN